MKNEWKEAFWVFGIGFLLFYILYQLTGAPIMTPDSHVYRDFSPAPWKHLGDWPATGLPFWLYGYGLFGLPQKFFFILVAALRISLVFLLFRGFLSRRYSLLALVPLVFDSQWIQMSLSYWTEILFLCHLLGFALLIKSGLSFRKCLIFVGVLFISATDIRTAGIFFLPGIVLGLAIKHAKNRLDFVFKFSISGLGLLFVWMGTNWVRSGDFFRPVKGQVECFYRLVSFNELATCNFLPDSRLCALDPERKFLSSAIDPGALHFSPESPYVKLRSEVGTEGVCKEWKEVGNVIKNELKIPLWNLIKKRIWKQFSRWTQTERGPVENPTNPENSFFLFLDKWNDFSNPFQQIYRGLLVIGFLGLVFFRIFDPIFLFLYVGGLTHALGISLNNPFLALRYQSIHKHCIYLAAAMVIFEIVQRQRKKRLKKFVDPK